MSLGAVLSTATRPRIPLATLSVVPEADRIVVENIVNVAQDISCFLRIVETSVELAGPSYKVTVPFADKQCSFTYRDMQKLMTYNPSRLDDMRLTLGADGRLLFVMFITNEKTPYDVSEYDVVRVHKRRRIQLAQNSVGPP